MAEMVQPEGEEIPDEAPKKSGMRRVLSWLPGLMLLAGLVAVVSHFGEGRKFAHLLQQARPAWVLVAALFQAATYVCAAAVWQRVLHRARGRCTVRSLVPVAVARLFVDQVLPTAGFGGRLLVVKALQSEEGPYPAGRGGHPGRPADALRGLRRLRRGEPRASWPRCGT